MLEKIGLPPKPSMRGGSWVVDASHCQGCSSQFTFINRKHHCRRCGGLFCNSCTQQRMILRGQGDSPVRICSPCKSLEDAARFELRYGHKNRSAKGISKQVQKQEEEILHQIVGADGKQESHGDIISDLLRTSSSASSSSFNEEGFHVDGASCSPEELRRQAVEEKNKYKILKGEGRNEEALQAFKRGKELERQAGALETSLRKNRRLASKASNLTSVVSNQKKDESEEFVNKKKNPSHKGKEEKSDLAAELRELGWSDADLHDAERKPVNLSVEGELFNLLGEITQRSSVTKIAGGSDKSQVVALKKKALLLKREGKLAEAKEELKRAKILEKQLEEQELLGDAEDSDDELSALIRSMDDDKRDDPLLNNLPVPNINFGHLLDAGDDLTVDNFDVTDNDMNDPELAAALKSFGWEEEDDDQATDHLVESNPLDREALQREVLTLKREALSQKHEGNVAQAMSLLKKAKLLENDLNTTQVDVEAIEENDASIPANEEHVMKLPAKSKLVIQKELLAVKKKALALRRGGHVGEADEELRKGKALEQQLEAMENVPIRPAPKVGTKNPEIPGTLDLGKDEVEAEVTEQDMHDPALMLVLKNLGWNDDDAESASMKNSKLHEIPPKLPRRSKADIQRELLGLKRKALALRRQGKTEEADAELERAKVLEEQLDDVEASSNSCSVAVEASDLVHSVSQSKSDNLCKADADSPSLLLGLKLEDLKTDLKTDNFRDDKFSPAIAPIQHNSQIGSQQNNESECDASPEAVSPEENRAQGIDARKGKVLAHKRKAVALKREGKLAEAREELRRAKLLESNLEGGNVESTASVSTSKATSTVQEGRAKEQVQKPLPGRDRFKMQQESLSHKRNALKLRREGKIEESEAELELAKALERQLEESNNANVGNVEGTDDVGVEDFLDPQLTAALKSIGWQDSDMDARSSKKSEPKTGGDKGERVHLEEMIKSERGRALALKREGKQAEALEALRSAKRLEKKLVSLT